MHSAFLESFFPLDGGHDHGLPDYTEIFARYAIWLPVAFCAERAAFRLPPPRVADTTSVKATDIAARKARDGSLLMVKPYLSVIRLHLLIFFFAFAHFMHGENFVIYAVVYRRLFLSVGDAVG